MKVSQSQIRKPVHPPLMISSTVNVNGNVNVSVNQSVKSVTVNECSMDRPRRNRKNPARFEEIYSVEQGQRSCLPLLISSTVNKCPLCPYNTDPKFQTNVARHFQAKHNMEFQLILTGNTSFEGISKRTKFRQSTKIQDSDLSKMSTSSQKPTITKNAGEYDVPVLPVPASIRQLRRGPPLLFIKAKGEKCPICKYFSLKPTSVARHFQARHKAQAQQVLNGRATYPGIQLRNGSRCSSASTASTGKGQSQNISKPPILVMTKKSAVTITETVKPVKISQRRLNFALPRFLNVIPGKCPSCNYTSEHHTNISRHFQVNHNLQVQNLLKGIETFPGISFRADYSNQEKKKLLSLMVRKAAAVAETLLRPRPSISTPIRVKPGKCPLCNYCSPHHTNIAKHFQFKHKLEFEQVMSGEAVYPGVFKREIKLGIFVHAMPVVDDLKFDASQMRFEPQKKEETSQHVKVKVPDDDFQDGIEPSVSSAKKLKLKNVKPQSFVKEVKVKQSQIVTVNENTNTPENGIYCAAPNNCNFTTFSPFQLMIHENVHSIMKIMPPFIKEIVAASQPTVLDRNSIVCWGAGIVC